MFLAMLLKTVNMKVCRQQRAGKGVQACGYVGAAAAAEEEDDEEKEEEKEEEAEGGGGAAAKVWQQTLSQHRPAISYIQYCSFLAHLLGNLGLA